MTNNDVLRRVRYAFDFSDTKMIEIFALADIKVSREQVSNWLKKDEDENFIEIYDIQLASFLNGFIYLKRGKQEGKELKPEKSLTNNMKFRKIRIALDLKDDDIIELFNLVDLRVSKSELSALFRKPTHKKYMACKDQFLRNFIQGIQNKYKK
jgi:uncharacterized protein YehS (DUF1456 family)